VTSIWEQLEPQDRMPGRAWAWAVVRLQKRAFSVGEGPQEEAPAGDW
jgi:hypothetical protein